MDLRREINRMYQESNGTRRPEESDDSTQGESNANHCPSSKRVA